MKYAFFIFFLSLSWSSHNASFWIFIPSLICDFQNSAALDFVSSSTWNDRVPALASDSDSVTCAVTGYGQSPWWKVDLGTSKMVEKVQLFGQYGQDWFTQIGSFHYLVWFTCLNESWIAAIKFLLNTLIIY